MAWIELHQGLGQHHKVRRLKRTLGIGVAQAIGHMALLWTWALDAAPGGDLSSFESVDIAEQAEWEGDPVTFVEALVAAGLVDREDGRLVIHDWMEYAGRLVEKRRTDAERKRMSRGRPTDIQRTAHVTVPNLTVPNQDPPLPPAGGGNPEPPEGSPEPLPLEDGPVLEPGDGDDILEARIPALVQVSSGVPDAESPETTRRKRRVHQYSAPFDAFWKLREWSGDKPVAYKRWAAAGLDVDEAKREVAMAAVAAQLADRAKAATAGVWYADWKHAEGWISGQRWNDPLKCEAGPKVVPIASGPVDDLAGYRKLVAWCHSDRERVEVLVDRARGVNKVVLDVAEALEILEGRGIDAAIRWVAMATQAGVKARQGVSRG